MSKKNILRFIRKLELTPLTVTLFYFLCALLWILFSNYLLHTVLKDYEAEQSAQLVWGIVFALFSSTVLYVFLRNWHNNLSAANNLLSTIIDIAPVRIFWKNKELEYMGCNSAFAADAGENNPADLVGKNDYQMGWKDQADLYRADDRRVIESERPKLFFEEPQTTPDGKEIWLSTSKVPLRDAQNEVIGILGLYEDITERKNFQLSLQRQKNTAQNYLDIVGVLILVLDIDKKVQLINRHGCDIIGYSADEVIGKNWVENFLPERFWKKVSEVGDSLTHHDKHRITYFENPVLTKNGEERLIAWRNTSLVDEEGTIIGILTSGEDITERKLSEEKILYLANFDPLTGLPNRTQMNDHLRYTVNLTKRSGGNFAILFLDLDHFKEINDSLGHSYGDELLKEIAHRLKAAIREEDTLSRLGGDEFILLLPDTNSIEASQVAQKLLEIIALPISVEAHEFSVTSSIGIALYPVDGTEVEPLLKNADTAMYRAKQEGRNSYCFFTDEMQKKSTRNLHLSNALRHAIGRNELSLVYQPQFSLTKEKIIGAEALLRWNHPEYGSVSPAEFIPIAEKTGLILPIGEWVLHTAVSKAKEWLENGYEPIIMAVNLSAVQFQNHTLIDTIIRILENTGLPPEYLELELTEGVAMRDPHKAISVMSEMHNRGVRMSIDDFGTGYSSLNYLKKFKAYKLKIDQSFVRDVNTDSDDKAIVSTIISMAKHLGLKTIAEGVETVAQLDYLRDQGCDEIQGYYFSKPVSADAFEAFRNKQPTLQS